MHRVARFEVDRNLNLQNLPFTSTFDPAQNEKFSANERMERLEIRILELERILKDYVFKSSALERLVKRHNKDA